MTSPVPAPISDSDRERTAELLQRACGEGRLTLADFSDRVGDVWAAETTTDLERATAGLAPAPIVGATPARDRIVTVFSESSQVGRWRLESGKLRTVTVFGSTRLDLREVLTGSDVIEITGRCVFGEITVIVPEGVEVDIAGVSVFSSRDVKLAPVPRVPGVPRVRLNVTAAFASVEVRSRGADPRPA